MDIERVRNYTLSLEGVTEDQPFGDDIITFRVEGKIFVCLWLGGGQHDMKNAEPRLALKLSPDRNEELREKYAAVTPAWHWNKKHWSDVYFEKLEDAQVEQWIRESYLLVASRLPKALRHKYIQEPVLHVKRFQQLTVDELYELIHVRCDVFVVEQNCVYQDLDHHDQEAIHLWLTVGEKLVAMARVCPAGAHLKEISIGRVITTERGKGYGKQIMLRAIAVARKYFGAKRIEIEAQEYAKAFYEGVGFRQTSAPFLLDGIRHIGMTWTEEV
ncbi:MAG: GNAT family N-acetyltransferase [Bacteroidales bacterium]|nr:GNAT family N-acetyltransferase [Bacteroidales bacterium]